MNVLIITKDKILSRMLFLEISAFGASVREACELSEETKKEIALCDFTVLDAELFAAAPLIFEYIFLISLCCNIFITLAFF